MSVRTETLDRGPPHAPVRAPPGLVTVYAARGRLSVETTAVPDAAIVGRSASADVSLDDPSVSREHLRVSNRDGALRVTDLGSHNGTRVDGHALVAHQPREVGDGAVIRVGNTLLVAVADTGPYLIEPRDDDELVGGAPLSGLRAALDELAASDAPVLVIGETGTGKELVAQALHRKSRRRGALVPINCAAIPLQLIESELFGHGRGAFTGSERPRVGLFRAADGGTLLLDEIGELPLVAQAKLLRALEGGEVRAVGEDHATRVSARVVCATHRALEDLVARGAFREDLYHRIAATRVRVPPLRERRADIPRLAACFADGAPGLTFTTGAMEQLLVRPWTGNVRELRNVVTASAVRARARGVAVIEERDLAERASASAAPPEATSEAPDDVLRARLRAALAAHRGNVSRAAQELQMRRAGLYEAIRRLEIDVAHFRRGR